MSTQFTPDGMKMFGILDLETAFDGCRFAIGIRNANDKSMCLGLTTGVFVCGNLSFQGEFVPETMLPSTDDCNSIGWSTFLSLCR